MLYFGQTYFRSHITVVGTKIPSRELVMKVSFRLIMCAGLREFRQRPALFFF